MKPRAPELATAAASSARPTHCIPPWAIGCSTPKTLVIFVDRVIAGRLPRGHADGAVESDDLAVEHRVLDDVHHECPVLVGVTEAGRVRHLGTQ